MFSGIQSGIITVSMLFVSNIFMTFAWYAHLKNLGSYNWFLVVLISWSIAFFEYMIMIPANRIGATVFTLPQLKIIQEVISLSVFIPFLIFYMEKPFNVNFIYAGLCLLGALYFMFK